MSALDGIRERATAYATHGTPGLAAPKDRAILLAAVEAVLEWCDTNQHPWHPSEGVEGAFSSQDWALDGAARRIRTVVSDALGVAE
jgi:hypothetical protein